MSNVKRAKRTPRLKEDERIEKNRRTFEQWLPSLPLSLRASIRIDFERGASGEYRVSDTETAWRIWLAGQTSPYRPVMA